MGAGVISGLEVRKLGYVRMRMGRVSSIGHCLHAVVLGLRGWMKQVIAVVLSEVLEKEGGVWGRLHRGIFPGCGHRLVRYDCATARDWGIGDRNGLGGGDGIPV